MALTLEPRRGSWRSLQIQKRVLYCSSLTCPQLGVKASAKALTEEELKPLLPEGFEDEVYEWFHFVPEYGYTGGNPKVKTPQELGIKTTPLERFFESEDWSQYL